MFHRSKIYTAVALLSLGTAAYADSGVTLYGTLDVGLANNATDTSAKVTKTGITAAAAASNNVTSVDSGIMTASFFGIKGVEDLGGGMEASFTLESYLNVDSGQTTDTTKTPLTPLSSPLTTYNARDQGGFWARNAYVGLKTNYGLIRIGQMDTLGYLSAGSYNPFGTASISPSRIFYTTDFYSTGWSNTVAYYAQLGDFLVAAQYGLKENGLGAKWATALRYSAGRLSASIGYEDNQASVSPIPALLPATAKSYLLNASYDFGPAKVFAQYGHGKLDHATAILPDVTSNGYQLGASIPVGAKGSVLLSYANGKQKLSSLSPVIDGLKVREAKIFSLGYDCQISKRTDAYVAYSENKDAFQAPLSAGPLAGQILGFAVKVKTFAVGLRHSF